MPDTASPLCARCATSGPDRSSVLRAPALSRPGRRARARRRRAPARRARRSGPDPACTAKWRTPRVPLGPWIWPGLLLRCGRARSESECPAANAPPPRYAAAALCFAVRGARAGRRRLRHEPRRPLRQPDHGARSGTCGGRDRRRPARRHRAAAAEPRPRVRRHAPGARRGQRAVHAARALHRRRGPAGHRHRSRARARPAGDLPRQPHVPRAAALRPALRGRPAVDGAGREGDVRADPRSGDALARRGALPGGRGREDVRVGRGLAAARGARERRA